ncbi:MAG TPA: hypothetical protein VK348_14085, partial [Planctomycetota bacterium]|nr:hypothetical protein [Planctomycetota bacterium]
AVIGLLDRAEFTAVVTAQDPKGAPLPYAMRRLAVEDYHGRRYLHLQANGPRGDLDRKACTIVFEVIAK